MNVLVRLKDQFSADIVARVALAISEDAGATRKAIDAALPAILDILAFRTSNDTGASAMFEILRESGLDGGHLGSIAQRLGGAAVTVELQDLGHRLAESLFGTQLVPAIDRVASLAGIRRTSAESLVALLAPFVLDFVAKATTWSGGFHAKGLSFLLAGQAASLTSR